MHVACHPISINGTQLSSACGLMDDPTTSNGPSAWVWILLGLALVSTSGALAYWQFNQSVGQAARSTSSDIVASGRLIYDQSCSSCHGKKLEGQPDWRSRLPNGRLPAPPHDESGHTWHHPDNVLFDITKSGVQSHAPKGYESDMPAFAGILADGDIWAVLAYIKSTWPAHIRSRQGQISRSSEQNQ